MKTGYKIMLGIALGFMFGFGSAWIWLSGSANNSEGLNAQKDANTVVGENTDIPILNAEKRADTDNRTENLDIGILSVENQKSGESVQIRKLSLSETAWVVIYEGEEGEPGNILGAGIFDEGVSSGTVELLRKTEPERYYYAIIHTDNGDRKFDYLSDLVKREEETGKLILVKFKAL